MQTDCGIARFCAIARFLVSTRSVNVARRHGRLYALSVVAARLKAVKNRTPVLTCRGDRDGPLRRPRHDRQCVTGLNEWHNSASRPIPGQGQTYASRSFNDHVVDGLLQLSAGGLTEINDWTTAESAGRHGATHYELMPGFHHSVAVLPSPFRRSL